MVCIPNCLFFFFLTVYWREVQNLLQIPLDVCGVPLENGQLIQAKLLRENWPSLSLLGFGLAGDSRDFVHGVTITVSSYVQLTCFLVIIYHLWLPQSFCPLLCKDLWALRGQEKHRTYVPFQADHSVASHSLQFSLLRVFVLTATCYKRKLL